MDDLSPAELREVRKAIRAAYERGRAAERKEFDAFLSRMRALKELNGSGDAFLKAWEESKHPRDHGKFSSAPGGGGGNASEGGKSGKKKIPTREHVAAWRAAAADRRATAQRHHQELPANLESVRSLWPEAGKALDVIAERHAKGFTTDYEAGRLMYSVADRPMTDPLYQAVSRLYSSANLPSVYVAEAREYEQKADRAERAISAAENPGEVESKNARRAAKRESRRAELKDARKHEKLLQEMSVAALGNDVGDHPYAKELQTALHWVGHHLSHGHGTTRRSAVIRVQQAAAKVLSHLRGVAGQENAVRTAKSAGEAATKLLARNVLKAYAPADNPHHALAEAMIAHAEEAMADGDDHLPGVEALRRLLDDPAELGRVLADGGADDESVGKAVWSVLKAYDESKHPRGKNGRFIGKERIEAAKTDPKLAKELKKEVKPEDAGKLDAALEGKTDLGRTKRGEARHQAGQRRATREEAKAKTAGFLKHLGRVGDLKAELTADDLHDLADHLGSEHVTIDDVRAMRKALAGAGAGRASFGGAQAKADMVKALQAHAKRAAFEARMKEHGIAGDDAEDMRAAAGLGVKEETPAPAPAVRTPPATAGQYGAWGRAAAGETAAPEPAAPSPASGPDLSGHQTITHGKKLRVGQPVRGVYSTPSYGDRPFTGVVTGHANEQGSRGASQYGMYSVKLDPGSELAKDRGSVLINTLPDGTVDDDRYYVPHPSTSPGAPEPQPQPAEPSPEVAPASPEPVAEAGKEPHEMTRAEFDAATHTHGAKKQAAEAIAREGFRRGEFAPPGQRARGVDYGWDRAGLNWGDVQKIKAGGVVPVSRHGVVYFARKPAGGEKADTPSGLKIIGQLPYSRAAEDPHKAFVSAALAAGKPVPPEVLADYPDLAPPPAAGGAPEATDDVLAGRAPLPDISTLSPDSPPAPAVEPPPGKAPRRKPAPPRKPVGKQPAAEPPPVPLPDIASLRPDAPAAAGVGKKPGEGAPPRAAERAAAEIAAHAAGAPGVGGGLHDVHDVRAALPHLSDAEFRDGLRHLFESGGARGYFDESAHRVPEHARGYVPTSEDRTGAGTLAATTFSLRRKPPASPTPPAPGFGDAGPGHPMAAAKTRDDKIRLASELARRAQADGRHDVGGVGDPSRRPDFLTDAARDDILGAVGRHQLETTTGTDLPGLYEAVGRKHGLTKHQFQRALVHMDDAGDVRLKDWPRMIDEVPDPDLLTWIPGDPTAMYHVRLPNTADPHQAARLGDPSVNTAAVRSKLPDRPTEPPPAPQNPPTQVDTQPPAGNTTPTPATVTGGTRGSGKVDAKKLSSKESDELERIIAGAGSLPESVAGHPDPTGFAADLLDRIESGDADADDVRTVHGWLLRDADRYGRGPSGSRSEAARLAALVAKMGG